MPPSIFLYTTSIYEQADLFRIMNLEGTSVTSQAWEPCGEPPRTFPGTPGEPPGTLPGTPGTILESLPDTSQSFLDLQ